MFSRATQKNQEEEELSSQKDQWRETINSINKNTKSISKSLVGSGKKST